MSECSDYQLYRQVVDIGLAGMKNPVRKVGIVDKIRKVLSLQTKPSVESIIRTTL